MNARRALFGLVIIPALAAGMMPAVAQDQQQIPAVEVHPVGTTRSDPNAGQWFVTTLNFEETRKLQVSLYNPASVPQTVNLYLADIRFDKQGLPEVTNVPTDIGTWGRFENPTVTVAPLQTQLQTFSVTAPKGADPGDHIGAVVAEQAPQGTGLIRSIKRLAVRFYATLPGDARKDFVIDTVTVKKDSAFFPREVTVTVQLRNTGRVRLESTVSVDGSQAKGPELLMSNAVERYVVTRPVKFWGGPVRLRIDAQTRSLGVAGPVRQVRVTTWVIPWHLLLLLALAAGLSMLVRIVSRRRGGKYRAIQSDLRRIERLLGQQHREGAEPDRGAQPGDATAAIRAAIKQAKRAGDMGTAQRLQHKLGDTASTREVASTSGLFEAMTLDQPPPGAQALPSRPPGN